MRRRLRARVEFQSERRVGDSSGGAVAGTWRTVAAVRGDYMPERGREQLANGHLEGSNMAVLRVRYSEAVASITTQARALINDEPHQIRSIIDPDQKQRTLEFVVERQVAPYA